jgi:hypothetical protein
MLDRRRLDHAGVVDDDVDLAEVLADAVDRALHFVGMTHITGDGHHRRRPGRSQPLGRGAQFVIISGQQGERRALACEAHGQGEPEAARSPGDENDVSPEGMP